MKSVKSASVNYAANKMASSNPRPIERVGLKAYRAWWRV